MKEILKTRLSQALLARFPDRGMTVLEDVDQIALFPAAHPRVGDLLVSILYDKEIMIQIGKMTHLHFDAYEGTQEERSAKICEQILVFLEELFADQVLLFYDGMSVIEEGESPWHPKGKETFKWSGPTGDDFE